MRSCWIWSFGGGDGDGVLAWLRGENPTHGIPVIVTATAGYPLDFTGFIELPVVDYLPKPFVLTALLEKVRSALENPGRRKPSNPNRVYPELFIG